MEGTKPRASPSRATIPQVVLLALAILVSTIFVVPPALGSATKNGGDDPASMYMSSVPSAHPGTANPVHLNETGSTELYSLMEAWGSNISAFNPAIILSSTATGSEIGETDAEEGSVNIGATDGYLLNASTFHLLNVPVAVSALLVYYHLPGITQHLNLNGTILAMIYSGKITTWNNPLIAAANPKISLPSAAIQPIVRSDVNWDTFLFSSLCYVSWSGWPYGYSLSAFSGTVFARGDGNPGVIAMLNATPYSISYVNSAYESTISSHYSSLAYAAIGDNRSLSATGGVKPGNYILPGPATVSADVNLGLTHLDVSRDQLAINLVLGGSPLGPVELGLGRGGSDPSEMYLHPYPLTRFEYALIKSAPHGTTVTSKALGATVQFLEWGLSSGSFAVNGTSSVYLQSSHLLPLTPEAIGYAMAELARVSSDKYQTPSAPVSETGSTLLYPVMNAWGANFSKNNSKVLISTASTGSGTGEADAEQGLVDIGATDGYLPNASAFNLTGLPVAISAQLIYYNLPSPLNTEHLDLNGTVLAMIYEGTITTWNNPMILAAQNATVQAQLIALSAQGIYPVKRADASEETFLFTSLCYESWSGFSYSPSPSALVGDNIPNMIAAKGDSGVLTALAGQTGSVGYVSIPYARSAAGMGLGYAALGDNDSLSSSGGTHRSNYVLPTPSSIAEDAELASAYVNYSEQGLALSLVLGGSPLGPIQLAHGGGGTNPTALAPTPYPDVNLEYALIKSAPNGTVVTNSSLTATLEFLEWAISDGNYATNSRTSEYLSNQGMIALTPELAGLDMFALASERL